MNQPPQPQPNKPADELLDELFLEHTVAFTKYTDSNGSKITDLDKCLVSTYNLKQALLKREEAARKQAQREVLERVRGQLPEKRDEFYGMGDCHDFSHCIPGYMDIESVDWRNEVIDEVSKALAEIEKELL